MLIGGRVGLQSLHLLIQGVRFGDHASASFLPQPVAVTLNGYHPSMVQEPIQHRSGERGIPSQGAVPLAERQIARDDQAAPLIPLGHDLEEQIGLLLILAAQGGL